MVKKGSDRSAKFSAKHDPFVNMLRAKALQNLMIFKYQKPALQQYYVDVNVQDWVTEMDLSFGKAAILLDLTKKYVWKIATMTDTEIEVMHQIFLNRGFTETEYDFWLVKLFAKNSEITSLYNFCHRETSKLWIDVEIKEPCGLFRKLENPVISLGSEFAPLMGLAFASNFGVQDVAPLVSSPDLAIPFNVQTLLDSASINNLPIHNANMLISNPLMEITYEILGLLDLVSTANLSARNVSPSLAVSVEKPTQITENYFINSKTGSLTWNSHVGATPWLDDVSGHIIGAYTANVEESTYAFAHIADYTNVTSVKLVIEAKENYDICGAILYLDYGSGWIDKLHAGWTGDGSFHPYESAELLSVIPTLAIFNSVIMKIKKIGGSSYTINCQHCKLKVVKG